MHQKRSILRSQLAVYSSFTQASLIHPDPTPMTLASKAQALEHIDEQKTQFKVYPIKPIRGDLLWSHQGVSPKYLSENSKKRRFRAGESFLQRLKNSSHSRQSPQTKNKPRRYLEPAISRRASANCPSSNKTGATTTMTTTTD